MYLYSMTYKIIYEDTEIPDCATHTKPRASDILTSLLYSNIHNYNCIDSTDIFISFLCYHKNPEMLLP